MGHSGEWGRKCRSILMRPWFATFCMALLVTLVYRGTLLPTEGESSSRGRIATAMDILGSVPAGRLLIENARKNWDLDSREALMELLNWGEVSRTDAVLTRHLDPATGKENQERQVTIFLRGEQTLREIVLDLAHELSHAGGAPHWDPYDPNLTAVQYIQHSIEGQGGEVDAVVAECKVGLELADKYGVQVERCQRYRTPPVGSKADWRVGRKKVLKDFYRVGRWKSEILHKLGGQARKFPLLSEKTPKLYSSIGNAPYPLALLQEYEHLTRVACENTNRRLSTLREPAESKKVENLKSKSQIFLKKRC